MERMDLPAAEAAKLVKRPVPKLGKKGEPILDENGLPVMDEVAVGEDEVFANAVKDGVVTVVTVDGQKLRGKAPAKK